MSAEKIPEILVLTALKPEQTELGVLCYPKLDEVVHRHLSDESHYWQLFEDAEPGTIPELKAARRLAELSLLRTAQKTVSTNDQLWVNRFTEANTELYATEIDRKIWNNFFEEHVVDLHASNNKYADELLRMYSQQGLDTEVKRPSEVNSDILVGQEWTDEFNNRFDSVLNLVEERDYEAKSVAKLFKTVLTERAEYTGDTSWNEWSVELHESGSSVMVVADTRTIVIGGKRKESSSQQTKKLVSHELLTHVARHQNARHTDRLLSLGLPDYIDAEEGLAIIHETAIDGVMPGKLATRYVAMGLALGVGNMIPSRQEMIRMTELRLLAKNPNHTNAFKAATSYVNRMYRGGRGDSPGGKPQAIFTKDLVYSQGYLKMCQYISDRLKEGVAASELMDYVLQGKFDPTSQLHRKYVEEVSA